VPPPSRREGVPSAQPRGRESGAVAVCTALLLCLSVSAVAKERPPADFLLSDWMFDLKLGVRALSVGQANRGRVLNAVEMPLSGRSWRFLPWIKSRRTNFGTEGLVQLLTAGADAVAEAHPGSVLEIGNIGLRDGGPISQSKSHQAGRDVDVGFYARGSKGKQAVAGRFLRFSASGKAPGGFTLDEERTWLFVKTLLASTDPKVQWMFMSEGVRKRLLDYAEKAGEDAELLALASQVMHQPTDSSDHADHIHIRIYCSAYDRMVGCTNYGPGVEDPEGEALLREVVQDLERRVRGAEGSLRAEALKRLALVGTDRAVRLFPEFLCDESTEVVEVALGGLRRHAPDTLQETILGLKCSTSPGSAYLLFDAVSDLRSARVWAQARKILRSRSCSELDFCSSATCGVRSKLCGSAIGSLSHSCLLSDGPLLMQYLDSDQDKVAAAARLGLQTLYAVEAPSEMEPKTKSKKGAKHHAKALAVSGLSLHDQWDRHVTKWRSQSWPRYMRTLLSARGYKIQAKLFDARNVKELLRAVKSGGPVSYSAGVALATQLGVDLPRILPSAKAAALLQKHVPAK